MNYIRHLNAFFLLVKKDKRLSSCHISLYMALFQCWNINRFNNPIPISRENVMSLCGIGSKNTYHKSLKELHQFGYIVYHASINKFHKSTVYVVKLGNGDSSGSMQQLDLFTPSSSPAGAAKKQPVTVSNPLQVKNCNGIKIDTAPVSILTYTSPRYATVPVPYVGLLIKHKHINSKQERGKTALTQLIFSKNKNLQEGINTLAPAAKNETQQTNVQLPSIDEAIAFFSQNNYPAAEASKFYNHYQSNGWLVGGKSPMQNWQSSAHKWMLNTTNFNLSTNQNKHAIPSNHHLNHNKDYGQPL
jgi:hypothetical protein